MSAWQRLGYVLRKGAYIPTEFFVEESNRLVYLSIPKVACTSIKEALFPLAEAPTDYAQYMEIHSRLSAQSTLDLSPVQRQYYKFAFVRNPFARLVSCYLDKVVREKQHTGNYYFSSRYSRWVLRGFGGVLIRPSMSFRDFARAVSRIPDWVSDGHFRSQHHFLFCNRVAEPDFIGRFERLEQDWSVLAARHGLHPLAHRNSTERYSLEEWYRDRETLELVRDRYRADIDCWYMREYEELRGLAR